jgi:DNA modification methylase
MNMPVAAYSRLIQSRKCWIRSRNGPRAAAADGARTGLAWGESTEELATGATELVLEIPAAQIAASVREFGWTNPVLVDGDGGIIAGHGRVMAARKLGMAEVPVIELAHLTDAQRKAYILADNKLALNAGWDAGLLAVELGDLQADGFDLALTGFGEDEIAALLADATTDGLTDEDEAPEPPVWPTTVAGDLWLLGRHRLICGDSTVATDVGRLLGDVKPHLMVTDPPYGVEYEPAWRNDALRADGAPIGDRAIGKVLNDDKADWREAWALFPGDVAYVWHAGLMAGVVAESLAACDFTVKSQIVWAKSHLVIGRSHYHWQHEPCWYAVRKGATGHWAGDRKQTTLWEIPKPQKSETGHGTQKPIECMRRPIENNSTAGQAIYEPFCGSGTTLLAAEQTARVCFAVELDPRYVDVIVQRWQNFTGKQATLDNDGRTFAEVAAHRPKADDGTPSARADAGDPQAG